MHSPDLDQEENEMDAGILIPLGLFAMVVLIVWIQSTTRSRQKDRQAEIVRQMIDKFSTGEAFAQAIQGPEGALLAQLLALGNDEPPKKTWKRLFVPGSILTLLGIGFLVISLTENDDLLIPAVAIGAPGLAVLLSTYVMWRVEERGGDGANDSESA